MTESEIKEKLKTYILSEIIRNKKYPLADDEAMLSGGLVDSYSLVHITVFIEKKIGVKIPDTDLSVEKMDTINLMTERIMQDLK
jgi:acyl carrier protein